MNVTDGDREKAIAKCRCPGGWCLNTPRADGWCGYCGDHCRKGSSHGGTR